MQDYSAFQQIKVHIQEIVPIERDNFHILIGMAVLFGYLAWVKYRRRPVDIVDAISLALFTGIALELPDLWDDIGLYGAPHFGASLRDIGLTLIVPCVAAAMLAAREFFRRLQRGAGR